MTTTKNLDERDVREAITFWLKSKKLEVKSIYLFQDPGDPPLSSKNIQASVTVEES